MKKLLTRLAVPFFVLALGMGAVLLLFSAPARAQGPIESAQATLFAATVQAQQTRDAADAAIQSQRATTAALDVQQRATNATATAQTQLRDAFATQAARTATAQAHATDLANVRRTATVRAQAQAGASATAQAHATATEQAHATATQAAHATATGQAHATETKAAYVAMQLESELHGQRLTNFGIGFVLFGNAAILIAVVALFVARVWRAYRAARQQPRSNLPKMPVEILAGESFTRAAAESASAKAAPDSATSEPVSTTAPVCGAVSDPDLPIPRPFKTAPVRITNDAAVAAELFEKLKDACSNQPVIPPAT